MLGALTTIFLEVPENEEMEEYRNNKLDRTSFSSFIKLFQVHERGGYRTLSPVLVLCYGY